MIEKTILSNLLLNEQFARQAIPLLKDEYFPESQEHVKIAYGLIEDFFENYNKIPSIEILQIELSNLSLNAKTFNDTQDFIDSFASEEPKPTEWLIDKTGTFIQDRAVYNAITESISILEGNSKKDKGAIPQILQDALSITFDTNIGHDYIDDFMDRYQYYHEKQEKIPFDIDIMNVITRGGLLRKTLNVFMAGTGGGKSMFMCHNAAYNLMCGYNVLYITLEMAEKEIARRIDANLLDVDIAELERMPFDVYKGKFDRLLKSRKLGKLKIAEYPTSAGHAGNFRHLLQELKTKKRFVPDIIYVDYLNICASSRAKKGTSNSYEYVKAIAEELRGLAVEFNVALVTATQVTRNGFNSSDMELKDTSESFGLPATADLMIGLIVTDELIERKEIIFKQLKNRYNDVSYYTKFSVGVNRPKMKFYNVQAAKSEQKPQEAIPDMKPFFEEKQDNATKFVKFKF